MTEVTPTVEPPASRVLYFGSAYLLRGALMLTASIGVAGLVLYAALNPSVGLDQVINPNPIRPFLSISGFANGLLAPDVQAYLTLAVFILVAAPIARTALASFYFRRLGEARFAMMGLGVFVLLVIAVLVLGPLLR